MLSCMPIALAQKAIRHTDRSMSGRKTVDVQRLCMEERKKDFESESERQQF
jgi:hypothetical protein